MLIEVINAEYLSDYKILISFNDGKTKIVDLKGKLKGPVFEPLHNLDYFRKFFIHYNTIEWPNGADIAPEYLYEIGMIQYGHQSIASEE
ncbi:MAG: DUF2442 domain-containing protein [Bacteroidetes bacterium]|nr:DUF2442 domain-containing protein [Bacteroidota bacterium]